MTSAPDAVSAQLAARLQGSRVMVEDAQDDSSRTWANPDGTFTTDAYSGPEWVQQGGDWAQIDPTLQVSADAKTAEPVAAAADISVSNGQADPAGPATPVLATVAVAGDAASLADGAASVRSASDASAAPADDSVGTNAVSLSVGWAGTLPVPTLDGNQATYAEVAPGETVRVQARPRGVETYVDLTSRPADVPAGGLAVSLPLATKGLTVTEDGTGGLLVKDAAGQVVSDTPPASVWDATSDPRSGDPANVLSLPTQLAKTSTGYALTVTVPASFLTDPATAFPVTIDPVATLYASGDSWVNSGATGTNYGSDTTTRVGTYDLGVHKARSFFSFSSSLYADTKVTDARLHVYQSSAQSCTGSTVNVKQITNTWSQSTVTWANQPPMGSTVYAAINAAYGFTGCPANWLNGSTGLDVTSLVDGWAGRTLNNYGLAIVAANEGDSNTWRSLYSSEASTNRPYLTVTYNHYPNKASGMGPTTWLNGFVKTTTPGLQLTASDPDGGNVFGQFSLYEGGTQVYPTGGGLMNGSTVASGQPSKWGVPGGASLLNGHTYHVVAWVADGTLHSTALTAGANFTVDTVLPSGTTVSSTAYPLLGVTPDDDGGVTFRDDVLSVKKNPAGR